MIRDRFLTLLFPDSPEDDQVQSQIESLENETEAPKMPTSFLKLPSELRKMAQLRGRHELVEFYGTEKVKVAQLVAALETAVGRTCSAVLVEIQHAKTKWLAELRETQKTLEAAGAAHFNGLEENKKRLGTSHVEDRHLGLASTASSIWLEKKKEIQKTKGNRNYESFRSLVDDHVHPPWDNYARRHDMLRYAVSVDARVGPSGVEWCGPGYGRFGHPPSTWECLGFNCELKRTSVELSRVWTTDTGTVRRFRWTSGLESHCELAP
ncbi:hypothetical protein E6O75_ATG02356 [Venturia nashicola]|uniref:Uncharacterized protein n=1 Tax=Venturia nashicola TaxID=86259 RepID=A0A4Z1PF85_9PEZI|nr:hypothetical protein E6O75_ATG02356 [Venturia nashicola]